MTQEEKAKAYDEAIERARKWYDANTNEGYRGIFEEIFPELAESEDERIKKGLIKGLSAMRDIHKHQTFSDDAININDAIDWLERQGETDKTSYEIAEKQSEEKEYTFKSIPRLLDMIEPTDRAKAYCQKLIDTLAKEGYNTDAKIVEDVLKGWNGEDVPMAVMDEKQNEQKPVNDTDEDISILDMVEPMFKVGDWIVATGKCVYLITKIDGFNVTLVDTNGDEYVFDVSSLDDAYQWTIQDAKDGDVLVSELCGTIMLYKGIEDNNIQFYCDYDFSDIDVPGDRFAINNGQHYGSVDDSDDWHPATKEQRNLLFAKMNEAGYEWDAEKKEVKLLITNGGDFETENCEQNTDWSEEDDYNLQCMIAKVTSDIQKGNVGRNNELIDWLKSLKERIKHK